jgi:hypothetical protein
MENYQYALLIGFIIAIIITVSVLSNKNHFTPEIDKKYLKINQTNIPENT